MKKFTKIILIMIAFAFVLGCATMVSVTVTKPAEVNMSGARNIAVFDFAYPVEEADRRWTKDELFTYLIASALDVRVESDKLNEATLQERMGNYITGKTVETLVGTDYFSVYTPNDVSQAMIGANEKNIGMTDIGLLLGADAIIVGSIDDMRWGDEEYTKERRVYNKKTKKDKIIVEQRIKRAISIDITYRVVNAETGAVIATESDSRTDSDDELKKNKDRLSTPDAMFKRQIDNMIRVMAKKLAPYKVRESRFLMKDKMKDQRMKDADNFVKGQIYDKALNIFMTVWDDSQNVAAGYNAAIMKEVMGDLDAAYEMMGIVMDKYPVQEVMSNYKRLERAIDQRKKVEEQMK